MHTIPKLALTALLLPAVFLAAGCHDDPLPSENPSPSASVPAAPFVIPVSVKPAVLQPAPIKKAKAKVPAGRYLQTDAAGIVILRGVLQKTPTAGH